MRSLKYDERYARPIQFEDTLIERHMAVSWNYLTLNWGRLEYFLYIIPLPIDSTLAHDWMIDFFADINTESKARKVRREVSLIFSDDPKYVTDLNDALEMLWTLCNERNKLVHGLWTRKGDGQFEVQPLKVVKHGFSLDAPNHIGIEQLTELNRLMDKVIGRLASIGAETQAASYLAKIENRRKRAAARRQA